MLVGEMTTLFCLCENSDDVLGYCRKRFYENILSQVVIKDKASETRMEAGLTRHGAPELLKYLHQ